MTHQPITQPQLEFVAYVRSRGPMTINQASDYTRMNNLHESDPYTLTLSWLKAAIEVHDVAVYRDGNGVILYAMPKLKKLKRRPPMPPAQTDFTHTAPATTAQLAAQAAKLAALNEQPQPEKETHT
jgi:hypothetical protein